jgi:hypothetical protein
MATFRTDLVMRSPRPMNSLSRQWKLQGESHLVDWC